MEKKLLIGITGLARSGKDTCAEILWRDFGFTRIAFADPLKLAAQQIFGLSDEETWNDDLKEVVIPYWNMSPRRILQLLGTEAVKPHFGEDLWIKRWAKSYELFKDTDNVVCTDVRFESEAAYLRSIGAKIVHLKRDGAGTPSQHVSESGVAFVEGDVIVHNNGTVDDLADTLTLVIADMVEESA